MEKKIDYNARNFSQVRSQLINFVREYYPDVFSDFNDASVGMMLLELNAAVGDMLSFHTDRMFNETQINYAQQRSSLLELARTFGLNVPGKRPSVTIGEWTIQVPPLGDTFDVSYCALLLRGAQAEGGGKVFETIEDCDFSSPFSSGGIPNRTINPQYTGEQLDFYNITKRVLMANGTTKTLVKTLSPVDYKPFMEVILPEDNVLSIDNIITLEGTDLTPEPSPEDYSKFENNWFEVEALAQPELFVEDPNTQSDNSSILGGKWENIPQRFIKEYTDNGFCKIIFGGGDVDTTALSASDDFIGCRGQIDEIGKFVNNLSLGAIPRPSQTMYIKYRIGGGADSNIGVNVISEVGRRDFPVDGNTRGDWTNSDTVRSLVVNNPIPALGGKDSPSISEIRNLVRYNFSSQNRCVTIKDYQSRIALMPGKFGIPFRVGVWEERNKINVSIIGLDESGKLNNSSTSTLKENIAEYLADYRMMNDYVVIKDGKIINLSFNIKIYKDKLTPAGDVISGVIGSVSNYLDINKWDMGDNIYISQLVENINNVAGVYNVPDLQIFNKRTGDYSINPITQKLLVDNPTDNIFMVDLNFSNYTLFGQPNSMFEIKFPEKDITVQIV